jgi:choline trimethylamine-lyase
MVKAKIQRAGAEVNERVSNLRERMLLKPEVCIERGYLMTESYKETEGEPTVIRRAKALAKILREMTICIENGELIVGKAMSKSRGTCLTPELDWEWYLQEINTVSPNDVKTFSPFTEAEKVKMREFLPYWKGKSLFDKLCAIAPENAQMGIGHLGHLAPNFEKIVTEGLDGMKKQVDEELAKLNPIEVKDFKKFQFLKAINISLVAAANFAQRYSDLARNMAEKESDTQRKAELERIAEACAWVPANRARTFYEALQSVWLTYIVLIIEGWSTAIVFGRVDQYLYPFYKNDIEKGEITREEVRELIALFYIKMNEVTIPFNALSAQHASSTVVLSMLPVITLGGISKEGKDAVNELSYLFIEAEKEVRLSWEEIAIRVNRNNPDCFLMKACEAAKLLRGKFKFFSDETAIQQLLIDGKPLQYARDYVVAGCVIPTVAGHSLETGERGTCNLPLMLELALNNGTSRLTGKQMGLKTGDPRKFKSYNEVWNAYKKQVEAQIRLGDISGVISGQVRAEFTPCPFHSALFNGCIEKGIDITDGGTAPYITNTLLAIGAPNVGDSLAAIKKVVFEDKIITISRLIDVLDKNFEGEEDILNILKSTPKYGNDDDSVDSIMDEVITHAWNEATRYKNIAGAIANIAVAVFGQNVVMGEVVGALPDGRKAREPIAEGGVSPYQGRNVSGPTATLRSVTKLDLVRLTGGSALNMMFNPDVLKDESKMRKFVSLIRTYCETGGYHIQFNIIDKTMLRDAQKYPERYRDLLVRVATFSAYFVELDPRLQNDIIARTEFHEV